MNHKNLSRKLLYSAVFVLIGTLLSIGSASAGWSDRQQLRNEMDQLHDYLQSHPRVSTDLQNNPQLVYNKKYLANHEDLERFLKRHPAVRQEISQNPDRVFGGYYRDDRRYGSNGPWGWNWGWGR